MKTLYNSIVFFATKMYRCTGSLQSNRTSNWAMVQLLISKNYTATDEMQSLPCVLMTWDCILCCQNSLPVKIKQLKIIFLSSLSILKARNTMKWLGFAAISPLGPCIMDVHRCRKVDTFLTTFTFARFKISGWKVVRGKWFWQRNLQC